MQNARIRGKLFGVVFLKRAHLILGLLLFVIFLITGQYMRIDFPDKEAISQELRILTRSRHIYILLNSMIHVALGLYLQVRARKVLQIAGSGLLTLSSMLLVWAWYVETYQLAHFSDVSRWGIYLTAAGVGIHLLSNLRTRQSQLDANATL